MSKYFSDKFSSLTPYTPGEQPLDKKYVKLNTNESPFPPSDKAKEYALKTSRSLNLYSDPNCVELTKELAKLYNIKPGNIMFTNGSDDILNFAFVAFCDEKHPAVFPDITYGFYSVFAEYNHIPFEEIPLNDDFSINTDDYIGVNKTIFIANPNAPTGMVLSVSDIEKIVESNPDNVVIIDEAYVDFGTESCVPLINKYDNLLVVQTFSKSRSMAGARLGFGIACESLINDLNTVRYSTNPYNINSMTQAIGTGTLLDNDYTIKNCKAIIDNREYTVSELKKRGFELTDSKANFVFAKSPVVSGTMLYEKLKEKGVLVRHFTSERLCEYNRISIGTKEQMDILLNKIDEITEEMK